MTCRLRALWLSLVVLCGTGLALGGCGGQKPFVWQEPVERLVWPSPPEKPRLRYLHTFAGPADLLKEKQEGNTLLRWLLGKTEVDLPLATPFALAADGNDAFWVADNGSRMVYRFDLVRGKVDYFQNAGEVSFLSPIGIAVDKPRQRIFVSDSEVGKILVLDPRGQLLAQWSPPEGFGRPGGIALDRSGRLYVADVVKRQVMIFSPEGVLLERRGSKLESSGDFGRPLGVAIGPHDELLVLDSGNFWVEIQDAHGGSLGKIGQVGDVPGTFARPRGIAVNSQGLVVVSDAAFDNVQVFDLTGQLLIYFGLPGVAPGQFRLPAGLCFDEAGRLFVADSYNHRVQVFEFVADGS